MKMPPPRAVCAGREHDRVLYFFLPWVLREISPTRVFAGGGADRLRVSGRHWSSSGAVEQPRTAQGRPRNGPAVARRDGH